MTKFEIKEDEMKNFHYHQSEAEKILNNFGVVRHGSVRQRKFFIAALQVLAGRRSSFNSSIENVELMKLITKNIEKKYIESIAPVLPFKIIEKTNMLKVPEIYRPIYKDVGWIKEKVLVQDVTLAKEVLDEKYYEAEKRNIAREKGREFRERMDMEDEDLLSQRIENRLTRFEYNQDIYTLHLKKDRYSAVYGDIKPVSTDKKDYITHIPEKKNLKYEMMDVYSYKQVMTKEVLKPDGEHNFPLNVTRWSEQWHTIGKDDKTKISEFLYEEIMLKNSCPMLKYRYLNRNDIRKALNYSKVRNNGSRKSSRSNGSNNRFDKSKIINNEILQQIEDLPVEEIKTRIINDLDTVSLIKLARNDKRAMLRMMKGKLHIKASYDLGEFEDKIKLLPYEVRFLDCVMRSSMTGNKISYYQKKDHNKWIKSRKKEAKKKKYRNPKNELAVVPDYVESYHEQMKLIYGPDILVDNWIFLCKNLLYYDNSGFEDY